MKLKRIKTEVIKAIRNYFLLLIAVFVGLVAGVFLLAYYFLSDSKLDWQSNLSHLDTPRIFRLLDGKLVEKEKIALKPITVTLENHFESRPTAGLEYASIIYETVVEGDVTRFLAIFDGDIKAKKIGPVRSARPFFVKLAEEWQPVYFHAGGSQAALAQLKLSSMWNINEISGDGIYFWRDNTKKPPHNLFTSSDLIKRAIAAKEIELKANFSPWLFKNDQPKENELNLVTDIEINFTGNPLYQVKYQYNLKDNDYTRYLAGKIHKTDRGIILKAKNIILQYVNYDIIDDYGRLDINLISGGKAEIYQDGKFIEGYWQKNKGRTRFYNQNNEEIRFNRGVIWVELVFS